MPRPSSLTLLAIKSNSYAFRYFRPIKPSKNFHLKKGKKMLLKNAKIPDEGEKKNTY